MEKELETILREKDLNFIKDKITFLKNKVKNNFNIDKFDIVESEICIVYLKELIRYKYAEGIMSTKYFKIYKESGRVVLYSEFMESCGLK